MGTLTLISGLNDLMRRLVIIALILGNSSSKMTFNNSTTKMLYGNSSLKMKFDGFIDLYHNKSVEIQPNDIVIALDLLYELCPTCYEKQSGSSYNTASFYASAAALAIEDINNQENFLKGYRLRFIWDSNNTNPNCLEKKGVNIMLAQLNMNVSGFIGFSCYCKTVAKIASAVNLPLFSLVRFFYVS